MDGLRRTILVVAGIVVCAGAAWNRSQAQGNQITLRPVDTGRAITSANSGRTLPTTMPRMKQMRWAIKTNLVYAVALQTPNLAVEFSPGGRSSVEVAAGYNKWGKLWGDKSATGPVYDPANYYKRRLDHLFVRAGYRYWFRGAFDGFFAGADLMYANYRTGEFEIFDLIDEGFDYYGRLFGGSITGGWVWRWSRHWAAEFSLGLGVAVARHDKGMITVNDTSFTIVNPFRINKTYTGPTSVGVKLVFVIE
jgi:hypothetical protein